MTPHAAALGPLQQVAGDFAADKQAFPVPWGKAMMWIFLLSDTFIFSCFLTSYMNVRISTMSAWPNPSEVFALHLFGQDIPLILIAIMTFVLITSSGTMALAVNYGYRRDRRNTVMLLCATAALGATFVGMQAFEWTKLIIGRRAALGQSLGRAAVRLRILHDHRFPRLPRDGGRDLPAGHGASASRPVSTTARAATRPSRSRACTGTSSTSSGSSSSLSSTCGEAACLTLKKASNTRSRSTCGSGCCCSCSRTFSYLVDYFHLQGMLRWTLIILFMLLKAGFIVAIFMHMAWERLALKLAILLPPLCLLVLIGFMAIEGDYTFLTRGAAFLR